MPGYTDTDNNNLMHASLDACADFLCHEVICGICSASIKLATPEEDPEPRYCDSCVGWLDEQGAKQRYAASLRGKPRRGWEGAE